MRHERDVGLNDGRPLQADARDAESSLFPPAIRRWVIGGVGALLLLALYLASVRGTAILFDLRDAVAAFCF